MPCGSVHSEFRQKLAGVPTRGLAPAALSVECEQGFPLGVHKLFAREGFHTLAMSLKFGGGGAGAARLALAIESIARYSPSAALLVFPTNAVLRILDREAPGPKNNAFSVNCPQATNAWPPTPAWRWGISPGRSLAGKWR